MMWNLLSYIPPWAWVTAALVAVILLWPTLQPIWAFIPRPIKVVLGALFAGFLIYLKGRREGADTALQEAREMEKDNADKIRREAAAASESVTRDIRAGRLRDDDGWRRDD